MNNLYLYIIFVIKNKYNAIINNIIIATINITTINRFYNFILLNNVAYIFIYLFMHLADAFIQSDLHCIQVTVSTFYISTAYIILL